MKRAMIPLCVTAWIAAAASALAQSDLAEQWQAVLGGPTYDESTSVLPTADGGCVVAGGSDSVIAGNKDAPNFGGADYWLVKVDGDGMKDWDAAYGGNDDEYANGLEPTPDGGYLLAGQTFSGVSGNKTNANFGSRDYWLVKTDSNGNKLWEREFGSITNDFGSCMALSSNRYLLGGNSLGGATGNKVTGHYGGMDWWIINVDKDGGKQWEALFGGTSWDYLYEIEPTADGGFLLLGDSYSGVSGNKTAANYGYYDAWVIKIRADGSEEWQRGYGGDDDDWFETALQLDDGYLVGGASYSSVSGNKAAPNYGYSDWWLMKLDTGGNKVWEKTYGGSDADFLRAIEPTHDGGFLLFGTSWSPADGTKTNANFGDSDYWLVKVDANGTKLWEMAFGGTGEDYAVNAFVPTSDGGYILGGISNSGISGNKTKPSQGDFDYWMIKLMPPTPPASPELSIAGAGPGQLEISWSPAEPGMILQQVAALAMTNSWFNAPSGTNNPALVPTTSPMMHFRLYKP